MRLKKLLNLLLILFLMVTLLPVASAEKAEVSGMNMTDFNNKIAEFA